MPQLVLPTIGPLIEANINCSGREGGGGGVWTPPRVWNGARDTGNNTNSNFRLVQATIL